MKYRPHESSLFRFGIAGLVAICLGVGMPVVAQIPDEFQNLRVLPEDTDRAALMKVMRDFSFALGVRCQHCHTGGDGVSFEGVDFPSDDDPDKRKARFMMRMTDNLNRHVLPLVPERDAPGASIECKTCHRGEPKPTLLSQELLRVVNAEGADAAATRYKELRETEALGGSFDFGEWETNVVAEQLTDEGRSREAIRIYELNREYHPDSLAIAYRLGELYEDIDDIPAAIRNYERVLELRPTHRRAAERLKVLKALTNE